MSNFTDLTPKGAQKNEVIEIISKELLFLLNHSYDYQVEFTTTTTGIKATILIDSILYDSEQFETLIKRFNYLPIFDKNGLTIAVYKNFNFSI